jgi:hypothetical protein
MKKNILFIIVLALTSNTLLANSNISQLLGITSPKQREQKNVISDSNKNYAEPKKTMSKDFKIGKLLKYTKIKRRPQKNTCYGLKMGYRISKNISLSLDVLAEVDIKENYKIKSKEANLYFALSL